MCRLAICVAHPHSGKKTPRCQCVLDRVCSVLVSRKEDLMKDVAGQLPKCGSLAARLTWPGEEWDGGVVGRLWERQVRSSSCQSLKW